MKISRLLLLLLFLFGDCRAQHDDMFFHLSLDKGLSDARVTAIVQDRYGFMWIGTPNGLNCYDGYSIKTFYASGGSGLPANYISALFSDSKGMLWVGTSRGLARYNFVTGGFEPCTPSGRMQSMVFCIREDGHGRVYCGMGEGLFCWDRGRDTWENIGDRLGVADRLQMVKGLLFLEEDILFASTEKKGFYKIDLAGGKLDTFGFRIGKVEEYYLSMYGMERLNAGEILVGSLSFGLLKFNVARGTFSWPKGVLQKNDSIRFNTANQVMRDHAGRFWITSNYFRLAEYLPDKDSVVARPSDPYSPYGFSDNNASCVYEDRQHNIWVGTTLNGLYYFNPNRKRVRFFSGNDLAPGALQQGKVFSIAALDGNTLMIGTHKGPSLYYRSRNRFVNFRGRAINSGDQALEGVLAGLKDRHGIVWMGSGRLGLMRYDEARKKIRVFGRDTRPVPFGDDGISDMVEMDGDSLMVIGYHSPAIFHTRSFTSRSARTGDTAALYHLGNMVALCYTPDRRYIWLANAGGRLYAYEPRSAKLEEKTALLGKMTDRISALYNIAFDTAGRLWCATDIGAVCIAGGQVKGVYHIPASGKASAEVKNVLPAGAYVWLTNNRVVARLDPESGNIVVLGEKDGFGKVQLYGHSLCLSPWNTVLVGSANGFYEIFPDRVRDEPTTSAACLTAFRVYDKPLQTMEMISTVQSIRLSPGQNFFSFDLSAFDYGEAGELEYAYRLEGFDRDWNYLGRQRSGSYTNVPGGDYVLRLKVRNSSGRWNEQGQRIHIHIARPFWQTAWFVLLLSLVAGTLIYLIYYYRVRGIRRRARLRSDYEIRLNELENSALRTQMNPHFIFNSLNTINSFINSNERGQANQYIGKFAKLIRLILDHSREKRVSLADELEVAGLYVQLERIRFDDKFTCEIQIDETIDTGNVEIPPLIIQPFIENAILHGLLPLASGGILTISARKQEGHLLLTITDNGVGRDKAKTRQLPARAGHKSHGIEITCKRIELFNQEHGFGGQVAITDLKAEHSGQACGTRVDIPLAWESAF